MNSKARTNPVWLALSFLVGLAFVPLHSNVPVIAAMEATVPGSLAAAFITLFFPVLAIVALSEEPSLLISISALAGVVLSVLVSTLVWGFPGARIVIVAMSIACLFSAPAIIAGALVGSWLKDPSPNPFDRTSLTKLLAFTAGFSFVEVVYHLPPFPADPRNQVAAAMLVLLFISVAFSAYSDRQPWLTVPLMLGGIVFGVMADVSFDTKVDRNLWPIEIILMCAMSAPPLILGTAGGTMFGIRRRNRMIVKSV